MVPNRQAHLDILDGLRGIAILLVLWFHIWQLSWLPPILRAGPLALDLDAIVRTGFLGVDLFFFLSGFCLFYPYALALFDAAPRPRLAHFASRRAIKILPSYILAVAGAFALGYAQLTYSSGAFGLLRMHALFFLPGFPAEIASLNGVLWSLGVEVQFYLLFPAIAWCLSKRPLLTMLCAMLIASLDRIYVMHIDPPEPYRFMEQLPANIDLFVSGMFAAYAFRFLAARHHSTLRTRWAWTFLALAAVAGYVGISSLIYSAATMEKTTYSGLSAFITYATASMTKSWPYASFPVALPLLDLTFIALTLGSLFGIGAWRRMLANPLLVFLAYISYNLYLWHQMIAFEMFHHHVPSWKKTDPYGDPSWQMLFTLCATLAGIAVSWAITSGIERPLLRLQIRRDTKGL